MSIKLLFLIFQKLEKLFLNLNYFYIKNICYVIFKITFNL